MSTLVDDQTVLDGLDFDVQCMWAGQAHAASHVVRCRGCRKAGFVCVAHLDRWRRAMIRACRRGSQMVCTSCGRATRDFDESVEVMPL